MRNHCGRKAIQNSKNRLRPCVPDLDFRVSEFKYAEHGLEGETGIDNVPKPADRLNLDAAAVFAAVVHDELQPGPFAVERGDDALEPFQNFSLRVAHTGLICASEIKRTTGTAGFKVTAVTEVRDRGDSLFSCGTFPRFTPWAISFRPFGGGGLRCICGHLHVVRWDDARVSSVLFQMWAKSAYGACHIAL